MRSSYGARLEPFLPLTLTKVLLQKMLPFVKAGTRTKAFFEGEIAVADGNLK